MKVNINSGVDDGWTVVMKTIDDDNVDGLLIKVVTMDDVDRGDQ